MDQHALTIEEMNAVVAVVRFHDGGPPLTRDVRYLATRGADKLNQRAFELSQMQNTYGKNPCTPLDRSMPTPI